MKIHFCPLRLRTLLDDMDEPSGEGWVVHLWKLKVQVPPYEGCKTLVPMYRTVVIVIPNLWTLLKGLIPHGMYWTNYEE